MAAQGQYVKSGGRTKMGVSAGRMNDAKNLPKLVKSVFGGCYICRNDFALTDVVGIEIRKVGKRYRKVTFHSSCDS